MRVFVAGASGVIGRRLVPQLVEQGHEVTGTCHSPSNAQTNRLRTEGTNALLAAAREAGARRFIAQSFASYRYARVGGPVKTEDDPLDPTPPANTGRSHAAMRR